MYIYIEQFKKATDDASAKAALQKAVEIGSEPSLIYALTNSAIKKYDDVFDQSLEDIKTKWGWGINAAMSAHYHDALELASLNGNIHAVQQLMPICSDFTQSLRYAANQGQLDVIKVLLPLCDMQARNQALSMAAKFGHENCVKVLLESVETPISDHSVHAAAIHGHVNVVKMLAPYSSFNEANETLVLACLQSKTPIVQLLLEYIHSEQQYSKGLAWAVFNNNQQLIDMLLPLSNKQKTMAFAVQEFDQPIFEQYTQQLEQLFSEQENKHIAQHLSPSLKSSSVKKM